MKYNKFLIVGAGLFGAVIAEQITSQLKLPVTVIDRRSHIGGNCWSEIDSETGVEYHKYGSHIFHTSNIDVWNYINKFTKFNNYQHKVWTSYRGKPYSMPINLQTINSFYNTSLNPVQAKVFIEKEILKENILSPKNLEEKAISLIGKGLYTAFIRGYTIKQWEKDPCELDASIITRLPVRYNYDNKYFSDKYEGIPLDGYGVLFTHLFANPLISIKLNTDFSDIKESITPDTLVIYTGAIDEFFDYSLGRLEWRTVDFEVERPDCSDYQGTSVMNYADADIPYTRIHEFKHYHIERQNTGKTIIFKEYSRFATGNDEQYYPVSTEKNSILLNEYQKLSKNINNVIFGGRLGSYRYFDMDDTIEAAMDTFNDVILEKNK